MKYTEANLIDSTATISEVCLHPSGWFGYVKTFFRRIRIFVCSDCGTLMQGKELSDWEDRV